MQSWRPGEGCPWTSQNKVKMKRTCWWIGIEAGRGGGVGRGSRGTAQFSEVMVPCQEGFGMVWRGIGAGSGLKHRTQPRCFRGTKAATQRNKNTFG